jgi:heat shock protein HslJ
MNRFLLFAGVLSAGMSVSAGAQQSIPVSQAVSETQTTLTSPPVDGMVWELQTLSNGPTRLTVLKPGLNNPTVQFGGRAATGNTFCNVYRASYVSRDDLLRFGPTLTTRRACLPQTEKLEQQFLKLLQGTNRYSVNGNVLTLYTGADGRLVFQKRSGAKPAQQPTGQMQPSNAQVQPGQMQPSAVQNQPPVMQVQPPTRQVQPTVKAPRFPGTPSGTSPSRTLPSAVTIFDRASASDLGPDKDLLIVGPVQTACTGVVRQPCLLVKHPGEANWSLFSSQIESFRFRAGVTSLLRVRVERLARPAADGSNVRYRLVRVLGTQNIH